MRNTPGGQSGAGQRASELIPNPVQGTPAFPWQEGEMYQIAGGGLRCPPMGDSNPKNKQKQQAQQSAKKASNQKKPAVSSAPASGKKK